MNARALVLIAALGPACGSDPADPAGTTGAGPGSSGDDATSTGAPDPASSSSTSDPDPDSSDDGTDSSTGVAVDPDPFTAQAFEHAWLSSFDSTQDIDGPIDLGEGPFAAVTLVMDLESPCFPFTNWRDTPPPAGHNWPAKCDAFDRLMTFTIDPPLREGEPAGFELYRAITPFGGPLHLEADVTDWANAHPGEHVLRGFVSTWTDGAGQVSGAEGGYWLSARLEIDPGPAPRHVLAMQQLWNATVWADTELPELPFTLPAGTTSAQLHYIASGHGGGAVGADCIGPADEFCHREHTVFLDGRELSSFTPWRDDCIDLCTLARHTWPEGGTLSYCSENPCGAISSVQAPRANWCPGDEVIPFVGELPVGAGEHTLRFQIADIAADGGNWPVSLTVTAYGS